MTRWLLTAEAKLSSKDARKFYSGVNATLKGVKRRARRQRNFIKKMIHKHRERQ